MAKAASAVDQTTARSSANPLRPGGVVWNPVPIKTVTRMLEKLALDPSQRKALDARDPLMLNASNVLDTVRGRFTCSSMQHALALLKVLQAEAVKGTFKLERFA